MSDIAIKFENISKQYHLGTIGTGTLSHDLKRWWTVKVRGKEDPYIKIGQENVLSSHRSPLKSHLSNLTSQISDEYIWALRDINLEVKQGEVLGIIGKNGAGKSTLLKLLSRVTTPTTGVIKAKGRIASLLEVGTGFHPEMTGRENIFMNGSIMGMTKAEIRKKFDEIVDFAGVERYIDTPVKRYSSGMMVRLGFAVAAHLEPEILVVDEVLAVGDAEFQKKAIGKMQDVSTQDGRTVLFVSHNMQSISTLTNHSILLSDGGIIQYGKTENVIQKYLSLGTTKIKYENDNTSPYKSTITKVECMTTFAGNIQQHGKKMAIIIEIDNPLPLRNAALTFQIFNSLDQPVLHLININEERILCREKGKYLIICSFPAIKLFPDHYKINVYFTDRYTQTNIDILKNIIPFEVKVFNSDIDDYFWRPKHAIYVEESKWDIIKKE